MKIRWLLLIAALRYWVRPPWKNHTDVVIEDQYLEGAALPEGDQDEVAA